MHPTMQVMDEMIAIFAEMGFAVAEGPDIEDDFHNFTALNFPPSTRRGRCTTPSSSTGPGAGRAQAAAHPHQPGAGAHHAVSQEPPIRIIAPGRTYRCDSDATHTPMFHQIEGLVIDRAIHMGHLKWTLETFIARFFETDAVTTRVPAAPLPVHRAVGRDGRAVRPLRRRGQDRPGHRLAGDPGLRDGPPQRAAHLRPRSRRVAGLRLRHAASTGWGC